MFIECENAFNFNYDIGVSMFGISGGKIHKKKHIHSNRIRVQSIPNASHRQKVKY